MFLGNNQQIAGCSEKRRSKSRSRVWEKVVWFTRRSKAGKESKSSSNLFAQSPDLHSKNKRDVSSVDLREKSAEDCAAVKLKVDLNNGNSKAKHKVRKSRSFNYLRRRKLRQFGDDLDSVVLEENGDSQSYDTATGTFHDFKSEQRVSRQVVSSSSNSLLSEIAKGMNGSQQEVKEKVRRILSLPLDELTLNDGASSGLCTSPSFGSVRRCVSLSGSAYNSWPRKKRTYLGNACFDFLSPPLKQKRNSRLRKTATFSGFDSSKLNVRNLPLPLSTGAKSTPHLGRVAQIKNQNGSTVGVIHFYKSPASCKQSNDKCGNYYRSNTVNSRTQEEKSFTKLLTLSQNCLKQSPASCIDSMLPGLTTPLISVDRLPVCESAKPANTSPVVARDGCHGDVTVANQLSPDMDISDGANCLTFNIKSTDGPNSSISAFVVEGGDCVSNITCESPGGSSVGEVSVEKGTLSFSMVSCPPVVCVSMVDDSDTIKGASSKVCQGTNEPNCILDNEDITANCSNSLNKANETDGGPEYTCSLLCLDSASNSQNNDTFDKSVNLIQTEESITCSQASDNTIACSTRTKNIGSDKEPPHSVFDLENSTASCLPLVDTWRTSDAIHSPIRTTCTSHLEKGKHFWSRKPKINGPQFKQHMEDILQWFCEFNDEQKNVLIKRLLEECELPQMHMLSVAMEPILHKNCPPNCQDMLAWLPHNVTFQILSYLDSVSLCQCSQVNRTWNSLASAPVLWKNLCGHPKWQLSRIGEESERKKYTLKDGTIQWKKVFASRFLLHQNWLKGRCEVRTFEGHTQGISCVQFDDTRIVSGSSDKTIRVWDIQSGDCNAVLTLAGHSGTVRCLNLNGNRLVSGSVDRSIKVWDLSFKSYWSGASCKVTMVGHMHTVRCLQVDDEKVVSGSYDKTLKVWDIKTGHCKLTLRGHNAAVLCVQFDDRKIVSGSYDKTIKVWCLAEGTCLMTLTGHHDAVTCLNLTFDSRKVISGSLDHNLKFWDLATGKCIGTLDWIRSEGHTGVIRCLQTDSWRIVSAGDDKTLKMWSLESGQRLLTLRCHTDGVTCLHFNDYSIVSGSYDKTVKFWDFTPTHEFLTPG